MYISLCYVLFLRSVTYVRLKVYLANTTAAPEAIDRTSAVVLRDAVAVKSSPDQNSTDLFILHEGTKVEISDRLNGWCEITIADGKKGWMECSTFETI